MEVAAELARRRHVPDSLANLNGQVGFAVDIGKVRLESSATARVPVESFRGDVLEIVDVCS